MDITPKQEEEKVGPALAQENKTPQAEPFHIRPSKVHSRSFTIFAIILSVIFGFVGGFVALAIYTSQNHSLNLPGVSNGTSTISVTEDSDLSKAVEKVLPSVVSIVSIKNIQGIFGQVSEKGGGTGFVITSNGLIVTNKHVVSDTQASYQVFTSDGKSYDAKIESLDPTLDLAILKINAKNLKVITLGDSDNLKIGQHVVAVGNALGEFQNTVTSGIISAVDRTIEAGDSSGQNSERLDGLLQTDAAINPGNSGGPLINFAGQVIAINTAVASLSESQGIGFAIPINFAKTALKSYEKYGEIVRPQLGVRFIQLTPEISKSNDLPIDYGALIYSDQGETAVVSGSPADKAGLKEGDIITEINKEKVDETHGLIRLLQQYMPGDKITIKYLRDGKSHSAELTLGELRS